MTKSQIILCIGFGVLLFAGLITIVGSRTDEAAQYQLSTILVSHWVGVYVAGMAGFALLLRAVGGCDLESLAPLVLPLMAGLMMMQVHWSLALPLGLIVVALIVKQCLSQRSLEAAESETRSGFR